MHHFIRLVPSAGLLAALLALFTVRTADAQGIGFRVGPAFNIETLLASDIGIGLTVEYFWGVDDDGLFGLAIQYVPFGLNGEEASALFIDEETPGADGVEVSGGGPSLLSIMNVARFRLHDELDEPSMYISAGAGAMLIPDHSITFRNGTSEASMEVDLVAAFAGSLAVGVDYPIFGETGALTAQLEAPISLYNSEARGPHVNALLLSVGIEYRSEP